MFLSNNYEEIINKLKDNMPRPVGYHVVLKVHLLDEFFKASDGKETSLVIPTEIREKQVYQRIVGMVLAVGPACYQEERFKKFLRPEIGKWYVFPAYSGHFQMWNDIPLRFVLDEYLLSECDEPAQIKLD